MKVSPKLNKVLSSIDHPLMVKIMNEIQKETNFDFLEAEGSSISYTDNNLVSKILEYDSIIVDGDYYQQMTKLVEKKADKNVYQLISGEKVELREYYVEKINKNTLEKELWETPKRTNIKVGKFFQKFVEPEISSSQIEELVNLYKGTFSVLFDPKNRLEIVKGQDIIKYYHHKINEGNTDIMKGLGTLNKSCSGHGRNLDLYADNSNISMIILKSEKEENKISGRAILWKDIDGDYFMDRIYTTNESDNIHFYNLAKENNYNHREHNSAGGCNFLTPSKEVITKKIEIQLEKWDYEGFPYIDTIPFLDIETGILANKFPTDNIRTSRLLQLYGGKGGWVNLWDNTKHEPTKDPYISSHWN